VRYNDKRRGKFSITKNKAKPVWRYRMRYTKRSWLIIMLAVSLVLSACNFGQEPEPTPDVGAIFTAAAETVVAQYSLELTQTALAAPTATQIPTNTPVPTFAIESPGAGSPAAPGATPFATLGIGTQPGGVVALPTATAIVALATQGDACYNSAFVADITYPDGTVVKQDAWLAKAWSIQNTGTCTWDDGFALVPVTGDAKGSWVIDEKVHKKVPPGEIAELQIDIKTPSKAGEWGGCWRMKGDNDYYFGTLLCLLVRVE
jgi:hypothetical protein